MKHLILTLCLLPLPVLSAEDRMLLCLGTYPGFMMTITGDSATFDYLGDGRYRLDPALPVSDTAFSAHDLVTSRERWPVFIEKRACNVLQATLPVTIEIAVPSSAGQLPLVGCCKWQAPR